MAESPHGRGLSGKRLDQAAQTLRVLGHPLRLKLIERLARQEMSVGRLARQVREEHAVISQHLNRLHLHGLLARRREGREVYYRLRDPAVAELLNWVRQRQNAGQVLGDGDAI